MSSGRLSGFVTHYIQTFTTLSLGLLGGSVGGGEKKLAFYLVEVRVLGGRESEAALLGLEGEEAGQQTLGDLQVVPI